MPLGLLKEHQNNAISLTAPVWTCGLWNLVKPRCSISQSSHATQSRTSFGDFAASLFFPVCSAQQTLYVRECLRVAQAAIKRTVLSRLAPRSFWIALALKRCKSRELYRDNIIDGCEYRYAARGTGFMARSTAAAAGRSKSACVRHGIGGSALQPGFSAPASSANNAPNGNPRTHSPPHSGYDMSMRRQTPAGASADDRLVRCLRVAVMLVNQDIKSSIISGLPTPPPPWNPQHPDRCSDHAKPDILPS
jgi:hypothetical protein